MSTLYAPTASSTHWPANTWQQQTQQDSDRQCINNDRLTALETDSNIQRLEHTRMRAVIAMAVRQNGKKNPSAS